MVSFILGFENTLLGSVSAWIYSFIFGTHWHTDHAPKKISIYIHQINVPNISYCGLNVAIKLIGTAGRLKSQLDLKNSRCRNQLKK